MNKLIKLSALFAFVFAFNAQAGKTLLSCENGDITDVGDSYFQINFSEDGIEFSPYETYFLMDKTKIGYEAGTFVILNKKVAASAEGEDFEMVIDAMLTLNQDGSQMSVAISYDKGEFRSVEMTCK
jgi:hypothetical protein